MARMFLCIVMLSAVFCKPIENAESHEVESHPPINPSGSGHSLWKRFINPDLAFGGFSDSGMTRMRTKRYVNPSLTFGEGDGGLTKMRTKRSYEEDCEKYNLCTLHAKANRNFFAAFELYFVNKENARLWDHHGRSIEACRRRYRGCYDYDR